MAFLAAVEALLGFRAIVLKVWFTLKLNEQEKKQYLDVPLFAASAANLGFRTVRCHVPLCGVRGGAHILVLPLGGSCGTCHRPLLHHPQLDSPWERINFGRLQRDNSRTYLAK